MKKSNLSLKCLLLIVFLTGNHVTKSQTPGKSATLKSSGLAPVNGQKIYYEIHGEGYPVVLLHGAYMTIDMNWSQLIPELVKTRKVIAIELQGHGRTADIARPLSYPALASDVAGVMKYLKLDSADVLGYSFGGTVAFQLAIAEPKLVKKLIICSTVYKYEGWIPEIRTMFQTFQPSFFDQTPLMPEYKRVAPDTAHWHAFVNKMLEFDKQSFDLGEAKIKGIRSPVLLIMADNDGVDLLHVASMYKLLGGNVSGDVAGLPKSQLAIVPGQTHVSLMMETDKIIALINPFLNPAKRTQQQH